MPGANQSGSSCQNNPQSLHPRKRKRRDKRVFILLPWPLPPLVITSPTAISSGGALLLVLPVLVPVILLRARYIANTMETTENQVRLLRVPAS